MTMHFGIFRGAVLMAAIGMGGCATLFEPAATPETQDATKQAELAMARADAALRQGDLDRALFEYVNVLSLDEDKADAHYMVGVIHYLKGNLGLAMRAFQKTLSIAKDHAGALE
ncbi:MAG: tetratricopeptide repeat protein, partial [Gammaproteobacteria bacterium]